MMCDFETTTKKIQRQTETCLVNMSRVLWPFVNMAPETKIALAILDGNASIAYDMHAPPKSCPTKITCRKFEKKGTYIIKCSK